LIRWFISVKVFIQDTEWERGVVRLSWIGCNLPFLVIAAWAVLMVFAGLSGSTSALLLGGLAGLMFLRILPGK
jgi:hypothetical protein